MAVQNRRCVPRCLWRGLLCWPAPRHLQGSAEWRAWLSARAGAPGHTIHVGLAWASGRGSAACPPTCWPSRVQDVFDHAPAEMHRLALAGDYDHRGRHRHAPGRSANGVVRRSHRTSSCSAAGVLLPRFTVRDHTSPEYTQARCSWPRPRWYRRRAIVHSTIALGYQGATGRGVQPAGGATRHASLVGDQVTVQLRRAFRLPPACLLAVEVRVGSV